MNPADAKTDDRQLEARVLASLDQMLAQHPQLLPLIYHDLDKRLGRKTFDVNLLYELNKHLLAGSMSQIRQDLFVLAELGFKKGGYFVEFGATNGKDLSNTYLLEKSYGWQGILAEPAVSWHADLSRNRDCHIEKDCVWRASGETLVFNETDIRELSTIDAFSDSDMHGEARKSGKSYQVPTISLNDLLAKYEAPRKIDYLSIDTEGSEYEILQGFDFDQYEISIITCEHNYTPMRDRIHDLLSAKGYARKHENLSSFDDWYVKA